MSKDQTIRVNLADADDVKCDKCGDLRFEPVYLMKRLSPLLSPTGKSELIPIGMSPTPPIFACLACGHINEEFLPEPLRPSVIAAVKKQKDDEKSATTIAGSDIDKKPSLILTP